MKLRRKLLTVYLSLALVPLFLLGAVGYFLTQQALVKETLDNLDGTASRFRITLEDLADRDHGIILTYSNETSVQEALGQSATGTAALQASISLPATVARLQAIDTNMKTLLVLDLDGKIVASTDPKRVGESHTGEDFFERGKTAPTDNLYFKDAAGEVLDHLSAPVYNNSKVIGVVVEERLPKIVLQLVASPDGLGTTGEILLVKKDASGDATFVMPTRFDPNAAFTRTISRDDPNSALIKAFNGAPGVFTNAIDYRGKQIYTSSRYIDTLQLGLEVKMDRSEALAPMRNILIGILLAILIAAALVLVITFYVSKSIAAPIVNLTSITNQISLGKLDVKFDRVESKDEVGDLYRTFERILVSLKLAMREMGQDAKTEPPEKK
jgi:HAMP domain-containing protein